MTLRLSAITDWRIRDENDLPDVLPGEEYERVITPQKHVVLHRILARHLVLARLQIGALEVPFELSTTVGSSRTYLPTLTADRRIAVLAGMDVRIYLHNDGTAPAKPRAALIVEET